jgi:hypothetical protein
LAIRYRASVNLLLDDFDDYLNECSSATCPACGYTIEPDTLVVDKEGMFNLPGYPFRVSEKIP